MSTAGWLILGCFIYIGFSCWLGKILRQVGKDYPEPGVKKW